MSAKEGDDEKERGLAYSVGRFSVRQPVLVNLLALAMVILGSFVLSGMTREAYPNVPIGAALIVTSFPGASPEEIEQLITTPIEDEIRDVDGIETISSTSAEGLSRIWVEFEASVTDPGRKVLEITNEVNRVSHLPAGADAPMVQEATINLPVGAVAVIGEAPERVLREVARELRDRLEDIDGVAQATVTGLRDREIQVEVDPDRLAAFGVPIGAISQAVRARAANVPAGEIESGGRSRIVRGIAQATGAEELREVVIRPDRAGGSIRVRDVAEVSEGFARARTLARVNGEAAITFLVLKDNGADALTISERMQEVLQQARGDLPPGVSILSFGDTAHYVRANLDNLYSNALMGLLMVLGILWFFVGFRNATMAALGIPVAIAGGALVMHMLGITINLLSLLALILSLGVIVDDAIIIIENVYRHMEEGTPRVRAAVVGTAEVFWPVVASTATTCSAFLPMLLMTGVLGEFFAIVPKVIVAALIASLIEAFIVLPSHLADFGAVARKKKRSEDKLAFIARAGEAIDRIFERILRRSLKLRWPVIVGSMALCAGMIVAAAAFKEVVLFGAGDVEAFDVFVTMPTDTTPEETDRVMHEIELRILGLRNPDIEAVSSIRGMSRHNHLSQFGDHLGMVTVYMVPRERRSGPLGGSEAMAQTEGLFSDIVGPASLEVVKTEEGPPVGAPVAVRLSGESFDVLAELSDRVQAEMTRVPGTRDVGDNHELGKRELEVRIDEERAALYGLSTGPILGWLATAFDAAPVATTRDGDEEIDIRVRLREEVRNDAARIGDLRLLTQEGVDIALREVADIEEGRGLKSIRHRNGDRTITVTAQLQEGFTSAEVNRALEGRLRSLIERNPEVRFELGGEFEKTNESLRSLFLAFIVAALLIYTILASQFRSFVQPVVVMTAIPLSLIGVTLGFFVSGEPIGMIGLIGTVGLAGIVVNDSLVLVSFINNRREEGWALDEAIVNAARLRLRPIFLTSVTTIAGLAPLAFGVGGHSPLLTPMATAIAWGLTFSTVLILVVIPCLYRVSDGFSTGFRRIFAPLIHLLTDPGTGPKEPEQGEDRAPAE